MAVKFKKVENALVVMPEGEIDAESAALMRRSIDIEFDEVGVRNMVFDMSRVTFMDSSGIGMIIGRCKRVKALGGSVKIAGASNTIKRIIELSGLGRMTKQA